MGECFEGRVPVHTALGVMSSWPPVWRHGETRRHKRTPEPPAPPLSTRSSLSLSAWDATVDRSLLA